MKNIVLLLVLFSMIGCVSYKVSVPEGYVGEKARIDDSYKRKGMSRADLFFVESIDGDLVLNGLAATERASYGQGANLRAMGFSRDVRAEKIRLHLVGRVHHAAPIMFMANAGSNYLVEGDIDFTPKPNQYYVVRGELQAERSSVWLEDVDGNVVSKVLEIKGSGSAVAHVSMVEETRVLDKKSRFLSLSGGESIEFVERSLGHPESVENYEGNTFSGKIPTTTYVYKGLGEITFSAMKNHQKYVAIVSPEIDESGGQGSLTALRESEGLTLHNVAKAFYEASALDEETLDAIANRIWIDREADDGYTVDSLSWLCKVIGKSGNPRYRLFLQDISGVAGSRKLKGYASSSLKMLPDGKVEQYHPARIGASE